MSTWANRARAHFLQERQNSTTETTERVCVFSQERQKRTTETTESPLSGVLTVQSGRFRENNDIQNWGEVAANDPAAPTTVQADLPTPDTKGLPTTPVDGAVASIGTVRPPGLSPALLAASKALDAQIQAADVLRNGDETPDPDRWCYSASTAMNTRELDLFAQRLARFSTKGVIHVDAESMADKLVHRDRDSDDRALCLECTHLGGYGRTSWRCRNWQATDIAIKARDSQLPADLVFQLQRCTGLVMTF